MNYRKIYENHYGPIPKDETGRTYEIHHIDKNRKNNDPNNLKAVSIQEHYDIHLSQMDWAAALRIAEKMKLSHEEISKLASLNANKHILNGTHNFLGGKIQRERVKNGTHNFLGKSNPIHIRITNGIAQALSRETASRLIKNGTHNFLGKNNPVHKLITNGTHHFIGPTVNNNKILNGTHPWKGPDHNLKMIADGIHPFLPNRNPNKIQITCPHCGKTGGAVNMRRWHFDNCKFTCSS